MQDLFDRMHAAPVKEQMVHSNVIPFNATDEMYHAAARQSVVDAEDAAFTNVQFRRGPVVGGALAQPPVLRACTRSVYMWGKVAPEMIRALALNPFGLPHPAACWRARRRGSASSTHSGRRARSRLQKDTDPEFRAFMDDPRQREMFRAIDDVPARHAVGHARQLPAVVAPRWPSGAWSHRSAAPRARSPRASTPLKVAKEVATTPFGPAASLDWLWDVAKLGGAPIVTGEAIERRASTSWAPGDLVVGSGRSVTWTTSSPSRRAEFRTATRRKLLTSQQ